MIRNHHRDFSMATRLSFTSFIAVILLAGTAPLAGAAPARFESPFVTYDTVVLTVDVDTGDLDGDGHLDLVTANEPQSISVLLGRGDGTFQPYADFPAGTIPVGVGLGDLDGDGALDVVVGNGNSSNTISVLMGAGDGTFGAPTPYATGPHSGNVPRSVLVRRFDADAHLDVLVNDLGASSFSLFRGNGDGTLMARTVVSGAINSIQHVVAFDVDIDGALDLIYSDGTNVCVQLGNGDGTFGARLSSPTTFNGMGRPVAGHFDGDGLPDVALIVSLNPINKVLVALGNGDGTFDSPSSRDVMRVPSRLAVGDLDGDGRLDVVCSHNPSVGGALSILRGRGDGTLEAPAAFPSVSVTRALRLADFDEDGTPDLVATSRNGSSVGIFIGNGDATFGVLRSLPVGDFPGPPAVGDLDGDDWPDLVVPSSPTIRVFLADGVGGYAESPSLAWDQGNQLALGDFDGDEILDLVGSNSVLPGGDVVADSSVSLWLGNGDGTFAAPTTWMTGKGPNAIAVADFDHDGHLDVVVADMNGFVEPAGTTVSVLLGNGDGTFQPRITTVAGYQPFYVDVADFDGDDFPDLAVTSYLASSMSILIGGGDGSFSATELPLGGETVGMATGDVDGDGLSDLAYNQGPTATVRLCLGGASFNAGSQTDIGLFRNVFHLADMNRDGGLDLVTASYYANGLAVLPGNGDGTFTEPEVEWGMGSAAGEPVLADLDRDGDLDVAGSHDLLKDVVILINTTPEPAGIDGGGVPLPGVHLACLGNPSRGRIDVVFSLPDRGPAVLELFDVVGRRLRTLELGTLAAGRHRARLSEGLTLASGVYFARLSSAGRSRTVRAVVLD